MEAPPNPQVDEATEPLAVDSPTTVDQAEVDTAVIPARTWIVKLRRPKKAPKAAPVKAAKILTHLSAHQRVINVRRMLAEAVVLRNASMVRKQIIKLKTIEMDKQILSETGILTLLTDLPLFQEARVRGEVEVLVKLYRERLQEASSSNSDTWKQAIPPFRGIPFRNFQALVDEMTKFLRIGNEEDLDSYYGKLAYGLVIRGFDHPASLDGLDINDVSSWCNEAQIVATLRRAISLSEKTGELRRNNRARLIHAVATRESVNGERASEHLTEQYLSRAWLSMDQAFSALEVKGFGNAKPNQVIQELSVAVAKGSPVLRTLNKTATLLMLESKHGSLPQVRSAVKSWVAFASTVIDYDPRYSLPPQSDLHFISWLTVFRNPGTASNYADCVRWYCTLLQLPLTWYSDRVTIALRGLRKRRKEQGVEPAKAAFLLTSFLVARLVVFFDGTDRSEISIACLIAWQFLLRCQSELFDLQVGSSANIDMVNKPDHSAVWVTGDILYIRFRRRKNAPAGMKLERVCKCKTDGRQFCVVCRTRPILDRPLGTKLFTVKAASFLRVLRHTLVCFGAPHASIMGLKAFRAGRATELALTQPLGVVMEAGGWASLALSRYICLDTLDSMRVIQKKLDLSDDEQDPV